MRQSFGLPAQWHQLVSAINWAWSGRLFVGDALHGSSSELSHRTDYLMFVIELIQIHRMATAVMSAGALFDSLTGLAPPSQICALYC